METSRQGVAWRGVVFLLLLLVTTAKAQNDSSLGCLKVYDEYNSLYRIFDLDQGSFTDSLPFDAYIDAQLVMTSPDGTRLSYLRPVDDEGSRYALVTADVLHPLDETVLYESLPDPGIPGFLPSDNDDQFQAYWLPDSQHLLYRWLDDPPRQMIGLSNVESNATAALEVQLPDEASSFKIDGIAANGDYFSTTYFTPDGYRLRFWKTADLTPLTDDILVLPGTCRMKVEYVNGRQYFGASYCTYWSAQGSRVAYATIDEDVPEGEAGIPRIVLLDLFTGEEMAFRPPDAHPNSARLVAWSPNGEYAAFTTISPDYVGDVSIVRFGGEQVAKITNVAVDFDVKDEVVSADTWPELRWSADSKKVTYRLVSEQGAPLDQYVLDVETGAVQKFQERYEFFQDTVPDGLQPMIWEDADIVVAGFMNPLSGEKQVVGSVPKPAEEDWGGQRWMRTAPNGLVVYRIGSHLLWSNPDGSQSGQMRISLEDSDGVVGVSYNFSADSRWLIRFKRPDFETDYGGGPVYVLDLQQAKYFVVEPPDGSTTSIPIFSPDSRYLAQWLKTGTPENTLRIMSLADMQVHDYTFDLNLGGRPVWLNNDALALGYIVSANSVWVDSGLIVVNTKGEIIRNVEPFPGLQKIVPSVCP